MFYVHVAVANAANAMPDMTRWLCCESDTDKNDVVVACCPAMDVHAERTDFDNQNVGISVLRSDSAAVAAAAASAAAAAPAAAAVGAPGPAKFASRTVSWISMSSWAPAEEADEEPMVEKPELEVRDDAMDGEARNDGMTAALEHTDVVCGMSARLPETSLRWSSSLRPELLPPQKPLGWHNNAAFSISRAGSASRLPSGPPMWKPFMKPGKQQNESTDTSSTNASTPLNDTNGMHGTAMDYARMVSWHRQASSPL